MIKACHYALDFGMLRGCPASECKKFTSEKPDGMPKFLRGFQYGTTMQNYIYKRQIAFAVRRGESSY